MAKGRKYEPKPFEAIGGKFKTDTGVMVADTSASIFESMLRSEAFISLTPKQRLLYVYCKAQYYGKRKPKNDYPEAEGLQGDDCFYFSWRMAQDYKLYPSGSNKNFRDDMKALINAGLIELVSCGKNHHKKNIYKYSSNWKPKHI